MTDEAHGFDRRVSDVNFESLKVQVTGLTGRVEVLEEQGRNAQRSLTHLGHEVSANTMLTKQSHEAIYGAGEDPGMKAGLEHVMRTLDGEPDRPGLTQKVEDLHSMFEPARNGFRMLGKVGNGVMRVSDAIERRPKTTALMIIAGVVTWSLSTTGKLPDWFTAVMKALLA